MRGGLIFAIALALSSPVVAECIAGAPVSVIGSSPPEIVSQFNALLASDKFRDVPGMITKWQAFIVHAKADPATPPEILARSYGWLAWSLDYVDRTDDAIVAAREGERIAVANGLVDKRSHADLLSSLSMVETDIGDVARGEAHARAALALAVRSGADNSEAIFAHNALAAAAYARGAYADAELEYGTATDIAVRCLAASDPFIVNDMASHAGVLYMAGRADDALAENERAANWALTNLPEDSPLITLALGNLGVMLRGAGRYAEAEAALRRVVDLEGKYQKERWYYRAISLSNFASVIERQGRHAEAEALWLQSSSFHAKITNKRDPVTAAYPLRFSADAAQARGDLPLALSRRAEALRLVDHDAPADHPEVARARIEYAMTLMLLGKSDEALAMATPAIKAVQAKLASDDVKRLTAEIAYARIVAAVSGADAGYQLIAPIAARLEAKLLDTSTARGDLLRYGPVFSGSFAAVVELALASNRDEAAFHALQLANLSDIVLVDTDVAARTAAASPAAAGLLRTLQDRVRTRQALDRSRSFAASANQPTELARLEAAIKSNDALIIEATKALDVSFPAFRALGRPVPVTLADYRARLRPGEVLLAPLAIDDGTLAIMVTQHGLVWARSPVARPAIEALVRRVRGSVEAGDTMPFDFLAATGLYHALVPAALRGAFAANPHLFYYASGQLATVPPALLLAARPGGRRAAQWLIQSHDVTIASTLGAHLPRTSGQRQAHFLGVGAPVLTASAGSSALRFRGSGVDSKTIAELPALPRAAAELTAMARLLGGDNRLLLGVDATEAALKAMPLAGFDIIAIATHGLAGGDFAGLTEPALVMTPPPVAQGSDDGLLTASEITGLRLDADWVILSACNTASGTGAGSPAYSGLASAFIAAGARALLVSHWPVRDDAAARLTVATLNGTRQGLGRAQALQRAMLALMHDRRVPQSSNPAVWAPFVLIEH